MAAHPFGDHIRTRRLSLLTTDKTFTLRRLAARLGIQPSYLSRLERGANPSLSEDHILALARELGDNADRLLALAGKLPADVRRILLADPVRLLPRVRALADPPGLGPKCGSTPPQFWDTYRESQQLARVGSFVRDVVTGEDFWSEEFFRIFGRPPDSPTPSFQEFLDLVHPEDRPAVAGVRQRLLAGEGPVHYAYRFRRGDGLWRHARAVARCDRDADGRPRRIHGTVQDVTTERQALDNLRCVARFPEENPWPVLRVSQDGHLAYANRASTPLLDAAGLAVGEPAGAPLAGLIADALADGRKREIDFSLDDGLLRLTLIPLPGSGQVNMYGSDITAWRDAAQALAACEARCRRLTDNAVLGVFQSTPGGRIVSANPALAQLFGFDSPEDLLTHWGEDASLAFANPARRQDVVRQLAAAGGLRNFESRYRRKDGSTFIGNLHARLSGDESNGPLIEGSIEDITERKQVEAELAASEERLKTHLRNFPLPTFTFALRHRELVLTDANKAAEALFRGRIGTSLGSPAERVFQEAPNVYLALWNAFEGRRNDRRRLRLRPPGADTAGLFDMTFVFVAPDTVMLHAEETTAVSLMRETLYRTSEQLRSVLDHVPCAVYFKDLEGRCIMVNRAVEETFGRPTAEIVGHSPGSIHQSAVAARIAEDDRRVLASGRPATFEEDVVARGQVRRFLTTKVPLIDERGEPYALCGMSLDITDQKKLEREIQAERDTLRTILAHVPYAAILASAEGRVLFLNQRFVDLVGYTLEDIPDVAAWMPRAYPDPALRARVETDWRSVQGINCRRVYPVRCGDGQSRWLDFKSVALPDGRMLLTMSETEPPPPSPAPTDHP
ncbi:PAS domain S-box protein [Solidesulfovibrio sp.]